MLQLDLSEASKTNPYVQFSVFSNDRLSLICLNEDPRMDQLSLQKIANGESWLGCQGSTDLLLLRSLGRLFSYRKFISSLSARSF